MRASTCSALPSFSHLSFSVLAIIGIKQEAATGFLFQLVSTFCSENQVDSPHLNNHPMKNKIAWLALCLQPPVKKAAFWRPGALLDLPVALRESQGGGAITWLSGRHLGALCDLTSS